MNKGVTITIIILFLAIIAYNVGIQREFQDELDKTLVGIKHVVVHAEVADSAEERAQGLMFTEKLDTYEGMLFVFDTEDFRSFWMKDTLISLDLIFLDESKVVVDIKENFEPCNVEECERYTSKEKAMYVLEVNGGFALENEVIIGDLVSFD